jgi:hypothetical protein
MGTLPTPWPRCSFFARPHLLRTNSSRSQLRTDTFPRAFFFFGARPNAFGRTQGVAVPAQDTLGEETEATKCCQSKGRRQERHCESHYSRCLRSPPKLHFASQVENSAGPRLPTTHHSLNILWAVCARATLQNALVDITQQQAAQPKRSKRNTSIVPQPEKKAATPPPARRTRASMAVNQQPTVSPQRNERSNPRLSCTGL